MGISTSKTMESNKPMDEIVADAIWKMESASFKKLNNLEECNKLVNIIADIIDNKLTQREIKEIEHHIVHKSGNISLDIAKFYVKIAHVYASIIKTINPSSSVCGSRLFSLLHGTKQSVSNEGIPELDMLYNDSEYDYESGKFKGRSKKMDAIYNKNLTSFYTAFTGSIMDYNIKKFSDIKLQSHTTRQEEIRCDDKVCDDVSLFEKYAINISNNINYINEAKQKLTKILDQLFTNQNKKNKTINRTLTDIDLLDIVRKARSIIIDLYITCERNYENGVMIYEAIANKKILDTLQGQIEDLDKHRISLLTK